MEYKGSVIEKDWKVRRWADGQMGYVQWIKKLSRCFNILERLACRKIYKLDNNLKIIYVVE